MQKLMKHKNLRDQISTSVPRWQEGKQLSACEVSWLESHGSSGQNWSVSWLSLWCILYVCVIRSRNQLYRHCC